MTDLPPPPPEASGLQEPYGAAPTKVGPWWRLLARIIDGLVLLIPNLLISAVIGGEGYPMGGFDAGDYIASVVTTAIGIAYFAFMESRFGATLGKQALGFVVAAPQGGYPTPEQALRRNLWNALGLVPVLGSIITFIFAIVIGTSIANDANGRGPHDRFAGGTMVMKRR